MKPHEILQKIIDKNGSCDWSNTNICMRCPLGGDKSCAALVEKSMNGFDDEDYLAEAKRLLAGLEVNRIILGEDVEE